MYLNYLEVCTSMTLCELDADSVNAPGTYGEDFGEDAVAFQPLFSPNNDLQSRPEALRLLTNEKVLAKVVGLMGPNIYA